MCTVMLGLGLSGELLVVTMSGSLLLVVGSKFTVMLGTVGFGLSGEL